MNPTIPSYGGSPISACDWPTTATDALAVLERILVKLLDERAAQVEAREKSVAIREAAVSVALRGPDGWSIASPRRTRRKRP